MLLDASVMSDPMIPVTLVSSDAFCANQQAQVPASHEITRTVVGTRDQVFRSEGQGYVSYTLRAADTELRLFFASDLPASFSTAQARAAFQYATVNFDLRQPAMMGGGSLTLLTASDNLALNDLDHFGVTNGTLALRLVKASPNHYYKILRVSDLEPTNAPSLSACVTGDIAGVCACDFSGPAIRATLIATLPL
jgi:hypothetical protein